MAGQRFVFEEHDVFVFGRAQGCHVCLPHDPKVSRHHFLMEVNPPRAVLRDLGSLNGTYVNAVKQGSRDPGETPEQGAVRCYPEIALQDGDRIQVGDSLLAVDLPAAVATSHRELGSLALVQGIGDPAAVAGSVFPPVPSMPPLQKAPRTVSSRRCPRCGNDVGDAAGEPPAADALCGACRQQLADDPANILSKLIHVARREIDRRGPPPVAGYDIERKLGVGGFGAVYLARRASDSHRVAIKIMLSRVAVDETARNRFLREIAILESLRNDHIVPILDHGSTGTAFYFIMEYCAGGSVADLLRKHAGSLPLHDASVIILGALEGLAHAHAQGIVHRDIKPANILLSDSSASRHAKMADFGLARSFEKVGFSGMTMTGNYAGTFPFMPREQVTDFKHSKPCSDVWSLAATFYNMLTGLHPHDFPKNVDPLDVVLGARPVPIRRRNAGIPSNLAEVIDRALAVDPGNRFQSAADFCEALLPTLRV